MSRAQRLISQAELLMSPSLLSSGYAEPGGHPLPAGPLATVACNSCDTAAAKTNIGS